MCRCAYYTDRWLNIFPYNAKGNCFPRALSLYRLANRQGLPVQVHCGIAKIGEMLEGHAWLTLAGKPFLETGNQPRRFTLTVSFPPTCEMKCPAAIPEFRILWRHSKCR